MIQKRIVAFGVALTLVSLLSFPAATAAVESEEHFHGMPPGEHPEMGPEMQEMMEKMMVSMFQVFARPEITEALATFMKNYHDALVRKGFTKQEALGIVTSVGLPDMGK